MKRYWPEDIEKARTEAKEEHKLLVLGYDGTADADFVSAMTQKEFEAERAEFQKRSACGGWVKVTEDYTREKDTVGYEAAVEVDDLYDIACSDCEVHTIQSWEPVTEKELREQHQECLYLDQYIRGQNWKPTNPDFDAWLQELIAEGSIRVATAA